jgi:hypothetical protein
MSSTAAKEAAAPEQEQQHGGSAEKPTAADGQEKTGIVSYWGIQPPKLVKEDGTEWRWFCFRVSRALTNTIFLFFSCNHARFLHSNFNL